jgi:hypothetical protein
MRLVVYTNCQDPAHDVYLHLCHNTCCIATLFLLQMFFQATYLIPDPIANDVQYQASARMS